ncbi:hypothetical protein [Pelagibaculum spongiae]|uniref:Uncharacterized protein n=1 Tax=Pelagibaculum spongiae TaxID=2080658 RepID=A0A2V1H3E1_9GAMM|nr:hypothetical protein [Pelagibaculum spongiae]PVZ71697.1 hypothetical protein DC094_01325 [Pelagibaculum spongiae]
MKQKQFSTYSFFLLIGHTFLCLMSLSAQASENESEFLLKNSLTEICLGTAPYNGKGIKIILRLPCDPKSPSQRWQNTTDGVLVNSDGLCLGQHSLSPLMLGLRCSSIKQIPQLAAVKLNDQLLQTTFQKRTNHAVPRYNNYLAFIDSAVEPAHKWHKHPVQSTSQVSLSDTGNIKVNFINLDFGITNDNDKYNF